jgi:hypothetical protein
MVYNQTRNDWLIIGITYVHRCTYCTSCEGVTLTREEKHLGRWSRLKRKRGRLILR